MKCIVEWGRPKNATARKIVGISSSLQLPNPKQAAQLAQRLFFTMTEERDKRDSDFLVKPTVPRLVAWSADRTFWVAVSVLDGVPRGAYAGIADREAGPLGGSDSQRPLTELYALWDQLGDVPVTDDGEQLDAPFLHFPPGTQTLDVWHWFEAQNRLFVVGDVQQGVRIRD